MPANAGAVRKPLCCHVPGASGGGSRKPWAVVREAGEEGHQSGRRAREGRPEPGQRSSGLFSHLFPTARGTSEGFPCNEQTLGRLSGRGMLEGGGGARTRRRALQRAHVTHACDRPAAARGPGVASRG